MLQLGTDDWCEHVQYQKFNNSALDTASDAIIFSRLDYCTSVLSDTDQTSIFAIDWTTVRLTGFNSALTDPGPPHSASCSTFNAFLDVIDHS